MNAKKTHQKLSLGLAAMLLLSLAACVGKPANNTSDESAKRVAKNIEWLCSPELDGRLIGIAGNEKTAAGLAQKLKELGFEAVFGDNYLLPFYETLPLEGVRTLTLLETSGAKTQLEEGVHYIPQVGYYDDVNIEGEIILPQNAREGELALANAAGEPILSLAKSLRRMGVPFAGGLSAINFTDVGFNLVQKNIGGRLAYTSSASEKTIKLQNVLAVLPGVDRTKALIIGAHFDHMGSLGDYLYSGALDNASGLAAVLETATLLAGQKPPVDIVVGFWNAEEHYLLGSKNIAEKLIDFYKAASYINIDCLGHIGAGEVLVATTNNSLGFAQTLADNLAAGQYNALLDEKEYMVSDHISFSSIPSVNISQSSNMIQPYIHQPIDTMDLLDMQNIAACAKALAKTIIENCKQYLELPHSAGAQGGYIAEHTIDRIVIPAVNFEDTTWGELEEFFAKIQAQLKPDEYLVVTINSGVQYHVFPNLPLFTTLGEAQKIYPEIEAEEFIGGYQLIYIEVDDIDYAATLYQPGKLLKLPPPKRQNIKLVYQKGDEYILRKIIYLSPEEYLMKPPIDYESIEKEEFTLWFHLELEDDGRKPPLAFISKEQDGNMIETRKLHPNIPPEGVTPNCLFSNFLTESEHDLIAFEQELLNAAP